MNLTRKQRESVYRIFLRKYPSVGELRQEDHIRLYRKFRRTVKQGWGCVMVHWAGMWLGIEPDGYTHS